MYVRILRVNSFILINTAECHSQVLNARALSVVPAGGSGVHQAPQPCMLHACACMCAWKSMYIHVRTSLYRAYDNSRTQDKIRSKLTQIHQFPLKCFIYVHVRIF